MKPPVLHFAPGTCARVPLIALEEVGEAFETRLVAFVAGDHRKPDFLARNPAGKVPILEIEDQVLTQNTAILAFLAWRHSDKKLLPFSGDALFDARLLSRLAWFSADLHPLVTRIRMPQFFCDVPGGPERVREMGAAAMAFQLASLERALQEGPWILGADWSLLDAYLFWVWFRISGAGFETERLPAIAAHHQRMLDRPAVQRALAREDRAEAELAARGLAVPLD